MSNARTNTARLDAVERDIAEVKALLLALVEPDAPAKATRPKAEPKARKAAKPQVSAQKQARKTVTLTRKTRPAFVAKAPWAQGMSTQAIAAMCVEDPSLVPAGFAIGEGYRAKFA